MHSLFLLSLCVACCSWTSFASVALLYHRKRTQCSLHSHTCNYRRGSALKWVTFHCFPSSLLFILLPNEEGASLIIRKKPLTHFPSCGLPACAFSKRYPGGGWVAWGALDYYTLMTKKVLAVWTDQMHNKQKASFTTIKAGACWIAWNCFHSSVVMVCAGLSGEVDVQRGVEAVPTAEFCGGVMCLNPTSIFAAYNYLPSSGQMQFILLIWAVYALQLVCFF